MCPLAGWASSGTSPMPGRGDRARPGMMAVLYAISMRAADAIVSSAPKPMKIFPISEAWSQPELSSPLAADVSAMATARVGAGGALAGSVRSTSLSSSGEVTWVSAAGCASPGLFGAACTISLARADMARAFPAIGLSGVPAAASCALALATDGGIAGEVPALSAAASGASAFFVVEDFSAILSSLRCACLFQSREPCRVYLRTATRSVAALSLSELAAFASATALSSAAAAAGKGPAKHTNNPVANITTDRPPALMVIGNLPIGQPREAAMRPHGMSVTRQKKGIFGRAQAKAGRRCPARRVVLHRRQLLRSPRWVPAGAIDVMSLLARWIEARP